MKDLSIAVGLEENLLDGFYNRGKCAYLLGDNSLAFLDFQKLILIDPVRPKFDMLEKSFGSHICWKFTNDNWGIFRCYQSFY
jgi:hypothetical protein